MRRQRRRDDDVRRRLEGTVSLSGSLAGAAAAAAAVDEVHIGRVAAIGHHRLYRGRRLTD